MHARREGKKEADSKKQKAEPNCRSDVGEHYGVLSLSGTDELEKKKKCYYKIPSPCRSICSYIQALVVAMQIMLSALSWGDESRL
ncbi:hypothetical protein BC937DRAFT_94169 [Endogone sp. FLAS-F59071]|nr:hypothetical protein BC937DRAFT_94169 [Endogone sp. FLAS-F59071]|eukprot:RUS14216.1 hypothetical protein BC937DRAFT_94169 [Endogone sp. FLAS-F59071]